jgi:hypothetical protein
MTKLSFLTLLCVAAAGITMAADVAIFHPGRGGCNPLPPDLTACWSEPGELEAALVSSYYWDMGGGDIVECEVANDFIFDDDAEIVLARWWAGTW